MFGLITRFRERVAASGAARADRRRRPQESCRRRGIRFEQLESRDMFASIDVWNGTTQSFGHLGDVPQQWVNIVGKVSDADGVELLSYTLNGGPFVPLTIGPNGTRLQSPGDFNIDLDRTSLLEGNNTLTISAIDTLNEQSVQNVTITYTSGDRWPSAYTANWASATTIADAAQVVEGLWTLTDDGVRTMEVGFDRSIGLGNIVLDDYEVQVPVTIHSFSTEQVTHGPPGLGIVARWTGHDVDSTQPHTKWWPLGALGWYSANGSTYLVGNDAEILDGVTTPKTLALETPYFFKIRAQTNPNGTTTYSLKIWEQGLPEPSAWDVTAQGLADGLSEGSVLLVAHHTDATFGNVTITPLVPDATPPLIENVQSQPGGRNIRLTGNTNEWATWKVLYGLTTNYELGSVAEIQGGTDHMVVVGGLQPQTTYRLRILATDRHGNISAPFDLTATTEQLEQAASDEFNEAVLDTSIWAFVNPGGDASLVMDGTHARLTVPGGSDHDNWVGGNQTPRLMQVVDNTDFEVIVKFDAIPAGQFAMQGLVVEADAANRLRFDFHSNTPATQVENGDTIELQVFAASFATGLPAVEYLQSISITVGEPLYMRLTRDGDLWTQFHSQDGQNWSTDAVFDHLLTVAEVGIFAGNSGGASAPAHTAIIDFFINPQGQLPPDNTAPVIQSAQAFPGATSIWVTGVTNEAAVFEVSYGLTNAYELGEVTEVQSGINHNVQVPGLASETSYFLQVVAIDLAGNRSLPFNLTATTRPPSAANPIVTENFLPGNPASEWDLSDFNDPGIEGYATEMSVDQGQTVFFKINDPDLAHYRIDIYRMGYYEGMGARKVASIPSTHTLRQAQPAPFTEPSTGLIDAGNWAVSASWAVPADATSGIYLAKLVRADTGGANHIVFVVRDDNGGSDILFQTADTTWQAYNRWGGNSLYVGSPAGRAYKVSYNRPFTNRFESSINVANWVFGAEYPMVRWLEANGYDVSYSTGIDSDRFGGEIMEHEVFLSVGHDEYWSAGQRASVEAARNSGVDLAFFSGNEVYWKHRWESSIAGEISSHRTLVSYKETKNGAKIDPLPGVWTGTWRDARFSPPGDGGNPENSLTGTLFMVASGPGGGFGTPIQVPEAEGKMRFWRNTSVATLSPGETAVLADGTLGYEWDEDIDNGFRPAGLFHLSSTTENVPVKVLDYETGATVTSGPATHSMTLYRHSSGALVFGAGTVQWSYGLDGNHDGPSTTSDPRMQQATVNLLADMGAQPGSLQTGLVPATGSDDSTAPVSTILSITSGQTFVTGTPITISGTASDVGGLVGGVEVSVDGGFTWHPVNGRNNWSYVWTPGVPGTSIIRTRAVDDSGNLEAAAAGATVTTITQGFTVWSSAEQPSTIVSASQPLELGVKFKSDIGGMINGIRFFRPGALPNTHAVHLWSETGVLLASADSSGESGPGWQQVNFATPVAVSANTTYVASYFTSFGQFPNDSGYFLGSGVTAGPLNLPSSGSAGGNGVFSISGGFPNQSNAGSNYWVDVVLTNPNTTNPIIYSVGPAPGAVRVSTTSGVTITFNKAMNGSTINAATIQLKDEAGNTVPTSINYDANSFTVFISPTSSLTAATTYTLTVVGGANGVKDQSGNPLTSTVTSSFFTDGSAPVISAATPANGTTGVSNAASLTITFNHAMDPATISASMLTLKDASGNALAGIVNYNPATRTVTFSPSGFLLLSTTYTVTVFSGALGAKDINGHSLAADYSWSFTTDSQGTVFPNLFRSTDTPQAPLVGGGISVELGVKFTSDQNGVISGIRYYKGEGNTGTHVGSLWMSDGELLASAVFEAETTSGWQQADFDSPVAILAGTTYVASYLSPDGYFAKDEQYFASSGVNSSPLHAPSSAAAGGNGVYALGGNFPNQVSNNSNYWVDVEFELVPFVIATTPAINAVRVGTTEAVTVTFSEAVDPATITTSTIILQDPTGNVVPASVSYNAGTFTATLTPSVALSPVTSYTAFVLAGPSGVKDEFGTELLADHTWSYFTDGPAPAVSTTSPASDAVDVPTTASATVTFNHDMDPSSITIDTMLLTDAGGLSVPASVSYDTASRTATLTPLGFFSLSEPYTVTVRGGESGPSVVDLNDRSLPADYSWSFTTDAEPSVFASLWRSTSAPLNAADNTSYGAVELGVKFYSELDGYITGIRFYKVAGSLGTHIGNLWTTSGQLLASTTFVAETDTGWQQVEFATPVPIAANTTYVASYFAPMGYIAFDAHYFTGASVNSYPLHAPSSENSGGNGLYNYNSTSTFPNQTFAGANYWIDVAFIAAPYVESTTPAPGAGQVATTSSIAVTFSEPIDEATINTSTFLLKDPGGNSVPATVSYIAATRTATLTPTSALNSAILYTASVLGGPSGVVGLAGRAMAVTFEWSFLTDSSAPSVNSSSPAPGATGVSTSASVTVTFSHAMDPATITSSTVFLKEANGTPVAASVSYDIGSHTAIVTPLGFFTPSASYTVTVLGGATGPVVKDLNGQPLAANYTGSFTISAQPSVYPSLWRPSSAPQNAVDNTPYGSVELGVKFYSEMDGYISGIRFYKVVGSVGTHIGNLWSESGQLLASATFTSETSSGWQQVNFATPVAVTANTIYVASYFAPSGYMAADANYFTGASVDSYPLHAPSTGASGGNGLYAYNGTSTFPNQSYGGSNYWIDVVFSSPPAVTSATPAAGATGVSTSATVLITFDRDMDAATINSSTIILTDIVGNEISAVVSFDSSTHLVTLTPIAPLNANTTYTVRIQGGSTGPVVKDLFGNVMDDDYFWTFTTGPS